MSAKLEYHKEEIRVLLDGEIDLLALRRVFQSLESRDRKLIYFRYFAGLTQTKTAGRLGMSQVQVSRREKVILRMMRERMLV